uniref:Alpha-L-fucosidase C-terminal domain-containing protein n=1 Tax=Acrobeloides nanus TaxID=290746 RepID=A0A914CLF9_9BILA
MKDTPYGLVMFHGIGMLLMYTSQVRNNATLDPYRLYNNQTQANTIIYAFVINWPIDNLVNLPHVNATSNTKVNLFGINGSIPLSWTQPFALGGGIQVNISNVSLRLFPCKYAFVLKIEYAADQNAPPGLGQGPAPSPSAISSSSTQPSNPASGTSPSNNSGSSPTTAQHSSTQQQTKSAKILIIVLFFYMLL